MSFLYRPTPVVTLGRGHFAPRGTSRLPGATMQGIPAGASALGGASPTGAASRMRRVNTSFQPWIQTSGTMGSFLPRGLGQDDGSDPGFDFSTAFSSPDTGISAISDLPAPDLGLPSFSPNAPVLIPPSAGPLPPIVLNPISGGIDTTSTPVDGVLIPPAGAGPTGTGIPGTQPRNFLPSVQPSLISSITGAVKSFFSPTPAAPSNYKQLPGYGGAQQTASVLPGVSNTLLYGGLVVVGGALLLSALTGSYKGKR